MREALARPRGADEHDISWALRNHEVVLRWWQGLGTALSRSLEGSQARALLSAQISLCGADTIFLQLALDNAADAPQPQDVDRAKAALVEAREIESKARDWLTLISLPSASPSAEELSRRMAAYERGETQELQAVVARLRGAPSA
jgi:hypothetical protein